MKKKKIKLLTTTPTRKNLLFSTPISLPLFLLFLLLPFNKRGNKQHFIFTSAKKPFHTSNKSSSSSSSSSSLYSTLGIPKTATQNEITKAYRKLALKCHPDKVSPAERGNAEKKFKDIGHAYDILSDEEKRERYDLYGEKGLQDGFFPGASAPGASAPGMAPGMGGAKHAGYYAGGGGGGGTFFDGGMNIDDLFQQMNQGQNQNRNQRQTYTSMNMNTDGFKIDLADILENMMGMRHPAAAAPSGMNMGTGMNNNNMGMGTNMNMGTGGGGGGAFYGNGMRNGMNNDIHSDGTRQQQRPRYTNKSKPITQTFKCTLNELSNLSTPTTTKKLKVTLHNEEKIYTIHIQPGWKDGTKIKFKASKDGLFPPITFIMKEMKHRYIIRDGDDLVYECKVTEKQARKGVKIKVPIPTGDRLEIVTGPNEIVPGFRKRISGKGMPIRKPNDPHKERGDFIVKFEIIEERQSS